jgi:hypothetical protein
MTTRVYKFSACLVQAFMLIAVCGLSPRLTVWAQQSEAQVGRQSMARSERTFSVLTRQAFHPLSPQDQLAYEIWHAGGSAAKDAKFSQFEASIRRLEADIKWVEQPIRELEEKIKLRTKLASMRWSQRAAAPQSLVSRPLTPP